MEWFGEGPREEKNVEHVDRSVHDQQQVTVSRAQRKSDPQHRSIPWHILFLNMLAP